MASPEIGFSAEIPDSVIQTRPMSAKKLALDFGSFLPLGRTQQTPQFIVVGEFSEEYPEYRGMNASQIKLALQTLNPGWVESSSVKGATTLSARGANATTVLVIWDKDKGVFITGPNGATTDDSVQKILESTRIEGVH